MSYIEKSITPGEKVVHIGRFHWVYMAGALFWIFFGVLACALILAGGIGWSVKTEMSALYPNLPGSMFWRGWADTVTRMGGYVGVIRDLHMTVRLLAFGGLILGLVLFAHMMVVRATTEIAVTSDRIVLKEGVIARNVDEMNIDRIESVHVIQSVLGRILDYGTIIVRGMGVGEIALPPIAHPITLRNAIDTAREIHQGKRK